MLSGFAMIVIGVWLTAQAIGGNLAGRIRSWASGATGGDDAEGDGSRISGGGTRTGGGSGGGTGSGGGARVK